MHARTGLTYFTVVGLVVTLSAPLGATPFVRGDVDQNGTLDIADAIGTLSYLFQGTGDLTCEDAADVNDSGRIDLADAIYALSYLFGEDPPGPPPAAPYPNCGEDPTADTLTCDLFVSDACGATGRLRGIEGCKQFEKDTDYPPNRECMEYTYADGVLQLRHINAAYNCCPDDIVADIIVEGNLIVVQEREVGGLCNCLCLFDLELEIRNLPPAWYELQIHGAYGDMLGVVIDLVARPSEFYCEARNDYPWWTP